MLAAALAVALLAASGCGVVERMAGKAAGRAIASWLRGEPAAEEPAGDAPDGSFSVAADHDAAGDVVSGEDEDAPPGEEVAGGGFYKIVEPNGTVRFVANLSQLPADRRDDAERLAMRARSGDKKAARAAPSRPESRQLASADAAPPARRQSSAEVVIYTTSWCGTCKKTLAWLDEKGVDYVNKDIEEDRDWAREMNEVSKGRNAVPVVVIDGEVTIGFSPGRMEKLLGI
jgi:glutaredoxin